MTGLPMSFEPSLPAVRPMRITWSNQAFRLEGTVKLYIGAPMTIASAASISSTSVIRAANAAAWAGVRSAGSIDPATYPSALMWGTGLAARSR